MLNLDALSNRLARAISQAKLTNAALNAPNADIFQRAALSYWARTLQDPMQAITQQIGFLNQTGRNIAEAFHPFVSTNQDQHTDRRFTNNAWASNSLIRLLKAQYPY